MRISWPAVIEEAARIVQSYDTSVTLRQLFYRLVAAEILPNTTTAYKTLSKRTAEARRGGGFPALYDRTRKIHQRSWWDGPEEATKQLSKQYRRDRTQYQSVAVVLAVEKHGLVQQLETWFGNDLGIPILALGGYSSQTYVQEVARRADWERRFRHRHIALLYAGDFDPSGEDIQRDFIERVEEASGYIGWHDVRHVALTHEQVEEYDLPPQMGKATDSRASQFIERHGELIQVELDALAPPDLRDLFQSAIDDYWDDDTYQAVLLMEDEDRKQLAGDDPTDDPATAWSRTYGSEWVEAQQAKIDRFKAALQKIRGEETSG